MAALGIADHAYVLETGTISASGVAADIKNDRRIQQAYLGI
jgi:ABC-type branched-subunit amino acid transport system ATPase component